MARAIWKGVIRLGDDAIPVKLYSAATDKTVRFRLLHVDTGRPVKQRMVNPETGETVPHEEIRRGYELEDGVFVVLDDEELESLEPEKSRDIEVVQFQPPAVIDHRWYDRPYHLGPDGDPAPYYALVDALAAESKEGLLRWTMRNKEYVGALRVRDGHLMLVTLRRPGELVPDTALDAPDAPEAEARELEMAEQLVGTLAEPFDPEDYRDEHRERVLELIEAKAAGEAIEFRQPEKKRAAGDLAASLQASIEAMKERKSA